MSGRDHERHADSVGAYLLDALSDFEREAFERHVMGCPECRDEIERLRPAADALPRSVRPVAPPPSLKAALMDTVHREAQERAGRAEPSGQGLGAGLGRLARRLTAARPAGALAGAGLVVLLAATLGVGVLLGRGTSESGQTRTIAASVDRARLQSASASLVVAGAGESGAILRVHGMPEPDSRHQYQAWVLRGREVVPEPTFDVGQTGSGAVAVPDDLKGADAVLVTREPRGGSRAPTEMPLLQAKL